MSCDGRWIEKSPSGGTKATHLRKTFDPIGNPVLGAGMRRHGSSLSVLDSTDIGVIQTYRVVDYPDHMAELQTDDSAGVDVFIGLPEWRNRGVGSALIRQFLSEIVFADPSIQRCVIDPEPDNRRAIRAYENAGFQHVRSYRSEVNDVDVYLMVRERSAG